MTDPATPVEPGPEPRGPLDGIRVVDVSSVVMVPWSTQILADLGADVIAVEGPEGNVARRMTAGPVPGLSGLALNLLRNKRSLCLDLRQPPHLTALLELCGTADVVTTNLRPGSLDRLGLTYEALRARRPDIIFCQATGFPPGSERAEDPAYDDIIQAASGMAHAFAARSGRPELVPMAAADKITALTIAYALTTALFHRERTGQGQALQVPMTDAMVAFNLVEHGGAAIADPPGGETGYRRVLSPHRRPQRCADGRWLSILPYSSQNYVDLFTFAGRPDLADHRIATAESRVAHADDLYRQVEELVAERTAADWAEVCTARSIPWAPVRTFDDLVADLPRDDHPGAGPYRVLPQPVRSSTWPPFAVRRPAPLLGEHTGQVLAEAGLDPDLIRAVTGEPADPPPHRPGAPR